MLFALTRMPVEKCVYPAGKIALKKSAHVQ